MKNEYLQGIDTEIVNFPQTGLVFESKNIHNDYPTPLQEKIWFLRIRQELRLRRKRG